MSANVGLSTPRGSGTSGYVTKNHAHLRPRDQIQYSKEPDLLQHRQRQPDKQILEHEKAREIEVKVFDLRDQLEEEGIDEEEIETRCDALRNKLSQEASGTSQGSSARGLKKHQVHEMAAAKIEESDRLRRALGISKDYEEGSHWKKQEERMKDSVQREPNTQLDERSTAEARQYQRSPRNNDQRLHNQRRRDDDEYSDEEHRRPRERRRRRDNDYSDEDDRGARYRRRSSTASRSRSRSRSPR